MGQYFFANDSFTVRERVIFTKCGQPNPRIWIDLQLIYTADMGELEIKQTINK
jgi:hypothetical protein